MRKPAFCICQNKGADQLRSTRTADQPFVFTTSLQPSSMVVQAKAINYGCSNWIIIFWLYRKSFMAGNLEFLKYRDTCENI